VTNNNVNINKVSISSPKQSVRTMPSTSMFEPRVDPPPVPSSKPIARPAANRDPEHSTLQLAAFLRTTGPTNDASATPITLASQNISDKAIANSVHSNGDSSTEGLLRYQSARSQRYPPSPSASTQYGTLVDDDDSEDLELSMYPGARRKQKSAPQESLLDFLRSTGPPEPALPPSPTTPKALQDRFPNQMRNKKSQTTINRSETPQPKAIDIFAAAKVQRPRVMSPTPSVVTTGTVKGNYQVGGALRGNSSFSNPLNVHVPSSSMVSNDDYFSVRTQSVMSRQSSVRRPTDVEDIQSIRTNNKSIQLGTGPRDPVAPRSYTTDSLADFLRNTGPSDFDPPAKRVVKKSKSGFLRRLLGGDNTKKKGRLGRSGSTSGRYMPIVIPATVKN
jgi:hypothetical protein